MIKEHVLSSDDTSLENLELPELKTLFRETKDAYISRYQEGACYADLRPFIRELKALSIAMDDKRMNGSS